MRKLFSSPQEHNYQSPSPTQLPSPVRQTQAMNHVDVDQLLEEYAWHQFRDLQSLKRTKIDGIAKDIEKDDCLFEINRKYLIVTHGEPHYEQFHAVGAKPYTLFKSIYTNNTNRPQEYSFKTERTTESVCAVAREQGYTMGAEAELTLKTPCEIAELKAGFKHEMHFNNLTENVQTESLSWGVDSNVQVPPHYLTEASIVIEEMNYRGSYAVTTTMAGKVTVTMRRRRDNQVILPIHVPIVELFRWHLDQQHCKKEIKQVVTIDRNVVKLHSRGSCQFQFAMKQRIDLKESPLKGEDIMID